ncbi:MAG: hypothetical protein H6R48_975 [Proteobacteria bacterium]|nr:hypothetical protein [Pseudomonadota bacterium]
MTPPTAFLSPEYKLLILLIALGISYGWGRHDGAALEEAIQQREERLLDKASQAAQAAAAHEIASIEVKNVTVQRRIERETLEVPVYRDCRHSPDGLRALGAALENRTLAADRGELPSEPGPAGR